MDRDQAETVGGIAAGAIAVLGWLGLRSRRRRPKFALKADYDCLEERIESLEKRDTALQLELRDMEHAIQNAAAHARRVEEEADERKAEVTKRLDSMDEKLDAVLERVYQIPTRRAEDA